MEEYTIGHLGPDDRRVVDALVENGLDPDSLPADQQPRARRIISLLDLLNHLPQGRPGDFLTARTLQAVQRSRMVPVTEGFGGGTFGFGGVHLRDFLALAAILVIGASVMWPVMLSMRNTSRQIVCQSNLSAAALGLSSYGQTNRGAMPATTARLGDPWWNVNTFVPADDGSEDYAQSNSAHLAVVVRSRYVSLDNLACSENPYAPTELADDDRRRWRDWQSDEQRSYSYQNQYARNKPELSDDHVFPLLADRNPFFEDGEYHLGMSVDTNSANHGGRGQNVLFSDGHIAWLSKPYLDNGDNIYHVGEDGLDNYTGLEGPASQYDGFLVP